MRVISKKKLIEFWEKHVDSEQQLKTWHREASAAKWNNPADIKNEYTKASILKSGRVVFNICHNRYRLVVMIHYDREIVFIRFVGTHEEYDRIDVETI